MAPKKATEKVTKPKATPKKGQAGSSNAASPVKESIRADQNLLFLWSCFQSTGSNIDLKLVAEAWGISSNAARMRYARLKAHIEKMQQAEKLNEKSEEDAQMDEKKEDLNENDSEQEKDEAEGTNELVQEGLLDEDGLAMEG